VRQKDGHIYHFRCGVARNLGWRGGFNPIVTYDWADDGAKVSIYKCSRLGFSKQNRQETFKIKLK